MSGSLKALFQMAPLELSRVFALNRRRFVTQSHLYSLIKKASPVHFVGRQSTEQNLNSGQDCRGSCFPHLALCSLRCGGCAQYRPYPTQWQIQLWEWKAPLQPFSLCPSLGEMLSPCLLSPGESCPFHTPGYDLFQCCYREVDFSLVWVQGFCT